MHYPAAAGRIRRQRQLTFLCHCPFEPRSSSSLVFPMNCCRPRHSSSTQLLRSFSFPHPHLLVHRSRKIRPEWASLSAMVSVIPWPRRFFLAWAWELVSVSASVWVLALLLASA